MKRNIERFPNDFRFQLTDNEKNELVTKCDRFNKLKHSSTNPVAFTEQGVAMLSAVLRSETAVKVSIRIIKAFVEMKKFISNNAAIFQRLENVEMKQIATDERIDRIFKAHDRFIIIDEKEIYHFGASLKDLGIKWFAFSKFDMEEIEILRKLD